MTKELLVLLGDQRIGVLRAARNGRLAFEYDDSWRAKPNAIPLSLSMPLGALRHEHGVIEPFLWGLLPDNELVLDAWGKRFQVSARNAFALLSHVGEDCAGAVRFVTPARWESRADGGDGAVEWLDESQVGARLRRLREDLTAWRVAADEGQFSLGGAQPKTALLWDGARWGVPSGRIATTHILKPDIPGLQGHAQNEHFCLTLAGRLGLPVAESRISRFDGELAIVVTRYDRVGTGTAIARIHQEDVCQALGTRPSSKYENAGGPGARDITTLLRRHSRAPVEDVETFIRALALNWLIAGTDAHAKNYSVLIGAGARIRLAPLYDVATVLPYDDFDLRRLTLAMKIGGKYRLRDIGLHQWQKLAVDTDLDEGRVLAIVREMALELPERAETARDELHANGLTHAIIARASERISARARECANLFA